MTKSCLLIVAAFSLIVSTFAQTLPPTQASLTPPDGGSFGQSVVGYFTAFNTNLVDTFQSKNGGKIWTGVDSMQGGTVPLANSLGISKRVYKLIGIESVTRTSGVQGGLVSEQVGFNINYDVQDTELTGYFDGGYNLYTTTARNERLYGEIGLRIQKALTEHTYGGIGAGVQVPLNRQVLSAFAGATW